MLTIKKLVLAAACVALALGSASVAAEPQGTHLRIRVHSDAMMKAVNEAALGSGTGGSEDGDDDGVYDSVDGDSSGSSGDDSILVDPVPATPSPTTVEGTEAPTNEPTVEVLIDVEPTPTEKPFCSGEGEYTVSVEYAEGIYCVKGPACVADKSDGVCPGPQKGLLNGSRCGKVASGVYGCTLRPAESTAPDTGAGSSDSEEPEGPIDSADFCPGEGEYEMGVAGAQGVFCVSGQACVSNIADGSCPGPQKGLPNGSFCALVQEGVYGCKINPPPARKQHHKKAQDTKTTKKAHSKKNAKTHKHDSKKKVASEKKKSDSHRKQTKKAKSHARTSHHGKEN
ncbi:hypothetical protein PybrP1_004058 [[Pythium] brassicae (nom. inval.)]|nr:hypothetical protein PybrP1_004058 [[Pythium] brassicae (nom. inval.)]